jgi:hypothetical protein
MVYNHHLRVLIDGLFAAATKISSGFLPSPIETRSRIKKPQAHRNLYGDFFGRNQPVVAALERR